jgi:putative flippase GtrA
MTAVRNGMDLGRAAFRSSFVKFLIVGGLSLTVDAGLLYLLHGRLGMWLPPATAISFLAGFVVNFTLNRQWAFASSSDGSLRSHFLRYAALVAANLLVTVALVQAITSLGVLYLVAKVVTTGCISIANYFISKRWIFI